METLEKQKLLPEGDSLQYLQGEMPLLYPENMKAWDVYGHVCTQVIVAGMGEVIGINMTAVEIFLNAMQEPQGYERLCMLRKINAVFNVQQEFIKKK